MPPSGFTDAERARYVLWISEGYGPTVVQRLFLNAFNRHPPARSPIRLYRQDYEARGSHKHRGGNGRRRISIEVQNQIRILFNDDPRRTLREVAEETGVAHATVWSFVRKELKVFPCKLQLATALTEDY